MRTLVLAVWFVTAVASGPPAQLPQILPVDAAAEDAPLRQARDAALAAATAKNVDALLALVSPDLVLAEGSDLPKDRPRWLREALANPQHEWWRGLAESLALGGAFTTARGAVEGRREFCAPYFFARFPTDVPAVVHGERPPWIIIDKDVALHQRPDARSRVVARVSYALVQAESLEQPDPVTPRVLWDSVEYPENATSYVMASKIRNPERFHVCFANEPTGWRISLISPYRGL